MFLDSWNVILITTYNRLVGSSVCRAVARGCRARYYWPRQECANSVHGAEVGLTWGISDPWHLHSYI
jgi:hypothetical protein